MRGNTLLYGVAIFGTTISARVEFAADKAHAEKNAHAIFNSVHSAGRQWGSSVFHNGFALIPAVVPRGSVFYHGSTTKDQPVGPEWLHFEPESAENFELGRLSCRDGNAPCDSPATKLAHSSSHTRSYVHTYRNKRDLKLLLLDGLSAGKTSYGTLDTQDLILLEGNQLKKDEFEDLSRAQSLCHVVQPWGYDGLIRAGTGFEIINCNFTQTVTQMKVKGGFPKEQQIGDGSMRVYQSARAASQRYDGLGARLKLDFSSMVSGLFYPINTTNPDPSHPEFRRLAATPMQDLRVLKDRTAEIARANFQTFLIDWRYIADTVVERFSDRLAAMADKSVGDVELINELEAAAISYVDASALEAGPGHNVDQEAIIRQSIKDCMDHYLYPALPFSQRWNEADHMLYHSVITVMNDICTTFIQGWWDVHQASSAHVEKAGDKRDPKKRDVALRNVKTQVGLLVRRLDWTTWRKTRPCPVDQAMFIAMWPYGDIQDHAKPGCRKIKEINTNRSGYWGFKDVGISGATSSHTLDMEEL